MDKIVTGSAVRPVNGRFAGKLMVVVAVAEGAAFICDGRHRRLGNPKRKSLGHLRLVRSDAAPLEVNAELTDGALRRYLAALRRDYPDNSERDSI